MSHLIAPSILTANFLELRKEVEMINGSEADWIHLDIMDGVFVPNMTFGFPVIKLIKEHQATGHPSDDRGTGQAPGKFPCCRGRHADCPL
jgi:pentose-5-phosphate-3-epimerase